MIVKLFPFALNFISSSAIQVQHNHLLVVFAIGVNIAAEHLCFFIELGLHLHWHQSPKEDDVGFTSDSNPLYESHIEFEDLINGNVFIFLLAF